MLHHRGERFDFPRLSQESDGEIQWSLMIILIGEILGAYALTASLDRFPRFACGLDRPKAWLSRWAFSAFFPQTMLECGWGGRVMDNLFDEMKICICQSKFLLAF